MTTRPKKEKKNILFLLDKFLFCTICGEEMKGKLGEVKGKKVGKYSCGCKKRGIPRHDLEKVAKKHLELFLKSLFSSHFNELAKSYTKNQNKEIQKLWDQVQLELKTKKGKLIEGTDKWLRSKGKKKEEYIGELIKLNAHIDSLTKKLSFYNEEMRENERFAEQLIEHQAWFGSNDFLKQVDDEMMGSFFSNFVSRIDLEGNEIKMSFKHPFIEAKEVVVDGY